MPGVPDSDERFSPAAHALIGLLRRYVSGQGMSAGAIGQPQAWNSIVALALRHGTAPCLHRALCAAGEQNDLPESAWMRLEQARRATALDNLQKYGQFQRVARALQKDGIPVMALKGLHLAERIYGDISLRPMSDIDILIAPSHLAQAVAVLRELDYGHEEELGAAAEAMIASKCNLGFAHGDLDVWLEVHWSLDEPPARYHAVLEEIWRSAIPGTLGDAGTLVMRPEFLLLHVCAHLACNHSFAFSLLPLCDIAEIVNTQAQMDWDLVAEHGRRHVWSRGVCAALRLASDYLGAAVPQEVLAALGAGALERDMLAQAMDHLVECTELPDDLRTAPNLLALAGQRGALKKMTTVWSRVFVPRAELALIYGLSERSPKLAFYYAVRLSHLLSRYAASAWAMTISDPELAAAAARQARLAKWVGKT